MLDICREAGRSRGDYLGVITQRGARRGAPLVQRTEKLSGYEGFRPDGKRIGETDDNDRTVAGHGVAGRAAEWIVVVPEVGAAAGFAHCSAKLSYTGPSR